MPCPNTEQYSLDKFSWCVYFCRFCYAWWVFTRSGINKWGQLGKWAGQKPFSRSSWFPYKTTHFWKVSGEFQPKKKELEKAPLTAEEQKEWTENKACLKDVCGLSLGRMKILKSASQKHPKAYTRPYEVLKIV